MEEVARLIELAQERGAVSVIVGLTVPWTPEGDLHTEPMIAEQRASIASAQLQLDDLLLGTGANVHSRYLYIPFVAIRADVEALQLLSSSSLVCSIREESSFEPALVNSVPHIGATLAHTLGFTGMGWTIAIIDTGVDSSHTMLENKVVEQACYSRNEPNPGGTWSFVSMCPGGVDSLIGPPGGEPCDEDVTKGCAHGTHVAGIAAGNDVTVQGEGEFSGVAPDATLIAIMVLRERWLGGEPHDFQISEDDLISALQRVWELKDSYRIAAVNMSIMLVRSGTQVTYDEVGLCETHFAALAATVELLESGGIASVAASGNHNESDSITVPACLRTVVSVGNSNVQDEVWLNYYHAGDFASNSATFLDLMAPGSETQLDYSCDDDGNPGSDTGILSAVAGGFPCAPYTWRSGTSMASPHVAGAWAILRQEYPYVEVEDILARLLLTGHPIFDDRNGVTKPRIQVDDALAYDEDDLSKDVWVDFGHPLADGDGSYFKPEDTLADGVQLVPQGGDGTLRITTRYGTDCTQEPITISNAMTIKAVGGTIRIQATPCN